jgi:hypothetical protein
MRELDVGLEMRPVTKDDADMVADLETSRNPDDPQDPAMLRFWWSMRVPGDARMKLVAERSGEAVAFLAAGHDAWQPNAKRFGWIRPILRPDLWSETRYMKLIDTAESWLHEEQASVAVVRLGERFKDHLEVVQRRGYSEIRRSRESELDLVAGRDMLLAGAESSRESVEKQGVRLMTLDQDDDPDRMAKLYALTIATEQDIPTTVPMHTPPFDEWHSFWFENPGVREDRFWIAREGAAMVGLSVIGYPPTRGVPWTFFTGSSASVRGRGVARALKYATVAQAIGLGADRVRTNNDGQNAPILHLNQEMGYRLVNPVIELHRELGS